MARGKYHKILTIRTFSPEKELDQKHREHKTQKESLLDHSELEISLQLMNIVQTTLILRSTA